MPRGRRDENERMIIETLEAAGCSVLQLEADVTGTPDLLVGVPLWRSMSQPNGWTILPDGWDTLPGVNLLLEIKQEGKRLRAGQTKFAEKWQGLKPIMVRTPEEALAAIGRKVERIDRLARNVAQAGAK